MTLDSGEYGIRQILLVAERYWLFVLGLMVFVAAGSGYLSYTQAANDAHRLRVDSVVSLPSVDFSVIDMQSLFAQSLASIDKLGSSTLSVASLGSVEDGRRTLAQLSVQTSSPETAMMAMSRFVDDLEARVEVRHTQDKTDTAAEDIKARIVDVSTLLGELRAQPPSTDVTTQQIRQLAIATCVSSLAVLEQTRAQLQRAASTDMRVEVPAGAAVPAFDAAKAARWIRIPIVATLAVGFFAFCVALMIDAWPRLVGRR